MLCGASRYILFCVQAPCASVADKQALPQELAWASFALLRNTNVSGLLVWRNGAVLSARGTLGSADAAADPQQALASLSKVHGQPPTVLHCGIDQPDGIFQRSSP